MKNLFKFSAAALCALVSLYSCEKPDSGNDTENGPENQTPEIPQVTINEIVVDQLPETTIQAYYYGDYYEVGSGNVALAFVAGEIYENEDWELAGDGTIVFLDMNVDLAENPDFVVLPEGEYELTAAEDGTPGTVNASMSYITKLVADEIVYEEAALESGILTVAKSGDAYTLTFAGEVEGENVTAEYTGAFRVINSSEEGELTNLDKDIVVGGLTKASMANMGDLAEAGESETWLLSLGDKHYDLTTDWGLGNGLIFYVNLEPGLTQVAEGRYETFVDMMTAESLPVNTLIEGMTYWGTYAGCWYTCPAYCYEASLRGGYLDVKKEGSDYTISGELLDGYGKKVSFSYSGPVEMMEMEMMSVKSASAQKGFVERKQLFKK